MFIFTIVLTIINIIYILSLKSKQHKNFKIFIIFTIPLFGLILSLFIDYTLKNKQNSSISNLYLDISGGETNDKNTESKVLNSQISNDLISVDEALLFNSDAFKRKLVVVTIKDDAFKYLKLLKKALNDPDTETSHYAAAAISEVKRKMTISIQELSEQLKENPEDLDVSYSYIKVLRQYVDSGLLDSKTKLQYKIEISNILKSILSKNSDEQSFIDKISIDIELKNYETAKNYCNFFIEKYPNSEESYIMMMKYYHSVNDFVGFNKTIENLKFSGTIFSTRSLNIVRFWDKEYSTLGLEENK